MNQTTEALRRALERSFDTQPIGMLATDKEGRVVWKNRLAATLLPSLRRRMLFSRYAKEPLPPCGEATCLVLEERAFFVYPEESEGLQIYFLQNVENAYFEEFADCLLEYGKQLSALLGRSVECAVSDTQRQRHYLMQVQKQVAELTQVQGVFSVLKNVRSIHPGRTFAVSAGELVDFFAKELSATLEKRGMVLDTKRENGLVALLNFRDFCLALFELINFYFAFVLSNKLHLELSRAKDGECVFDLWGEDAHNVLSLYRVLQRKDTASAALKKQSVRFFPLFCALAILSGHRHRVSLSHEDGFLHTRIYVRTTLELPELVVRENEAASELARAVVEQAEIGLFSPDFIRNLGLKNAPFDAPLPLRLAQVIEPKLFD